MGNFVHAEQQGAVVRLTLDRSDSRNAIADIAACDDLVEAIDAIQADPQVRCVVLTGAGASFCAGGDLKTLRSRRPENIGAQASPADTRGNYRRGVQRAVRALWEVEVPMIAAVNGHAIGLGCDLACLCDLRLASDAAVFASSFVSVGLIPGDGGAWLLPRAIGYARAAQLLYTGDRIDANTALQWGLVSEVVAADDLLARAHGLAERIASQPPQALRMAKRLLREGQQQSLGGILELSAAFQALAHETEDHAEAVDAFTTRRQPKFTGR
jgi:enoyl-CoA hydratase/carnithine racemase